MTRKLPLYLRLPLALLLSVFGTAAVSVATAGVLLGITWGILAGTGGNPFGLTLGAITYVNIVIYTLAIIIGTVMGLWLGIKFLIEGNLDWTNDGFGLANKDKEKNLRKIISRQESVLRKQPQNPGVRLRLAHLYERVGRYKDMENAFLMSADDQAARFPDFEGAGWYDHGKLGMAYLSALSNVIRGQGVPIEAHTCAPYAITPESMGYTIEQAQKLAVEHLRTSYALARKAGFADNNPLIQQVKLAIDAATTLSETAFAKYDLFNPDNASKPTSGATG